MSDILSKILAVKAQEVAAAKPAKPLPQLRTEAEQAAPVRDFTGAAGVFDDLSDLSDFYRAAGLLFPKQQISVRTPL